MRKETNKERAIIALSKIPDEKAAAVADFAEYILKKYDEEILQKGIEKIVSESKVFSYLQNEEELYTVNDLKERYK
ncbi:MAG: hypothetical protein POELPBGB_03848 [Bacteroidia bacterium]|jgi:hypothetical protein|nr:hypothetical protein [Bacteroidia bacterium]